MKKEIELKYRINTKSDLELLAHFLEPYSTGETTIYHQENFYFDTPLLDLRRNGISVRLRKQNDVFFLCAKQSLNQKKSKKEHLSVRLEYEGVVEKSVARLMCTNYVSPIDVFSTLVTKTDNDETTQKLLHRHMKKAAKMGLQMIGSFTNRRTSIPIELWVGGPAIELELDHSTYPNATEVFEIEIEFSSEKQATIIGPALEDLFRKAQIKTSKSCSKSSRLFKIIFG